MTLQVVTVTNKVPTAHYYCYSEFHKSLERYGVKPVVLGMGEFWGGLITKPRTLRKWLREGNYKADCLVVVDSWDLVFSRDLNGIVDEWKNAGGAWTIGGERALFPSGDESKYPKCASSYRFPNSGFILSTPTDMLAVLESMNLDAILDDHVNERGEAVHENDQFYYQQEFLKQPAPMIIDTQCRFVWNLAGVDLSNFDFTEDGIVNRETGTMPYAIHFNGGSKTEPAGMREKILSHLSL